MKLLNIDDHALFRQGLKYLLLDLHEDLEYLEAGTLQEALEVSDKASVDFILLDYHLSDSKGENSLDHLSQAFEEAVIVVLSGEDSPHLIRDIINRGAAGFIPKSSTQEILIAALQLILAGGIYLPANVMHNGASAEETVVEALSDRQLEVLTRAVQGKSNKAIARELDIAEGTVKAHLSAAFRELGVNNRTEAVYAASRLKLVKI